MVFLSKRCCLKIVCTQILNILFFRDFIVLIIILKFIIILIILAIKNIRIRIIRSFFLQIIIILIRRIIS